MVEFIKGQLGTKRGLTDDSDDNSHHSGAAADEKKDDDEDALSCCMPKKKCLASEAFEEHNKHEPIDQNGNWDPLMWGVDCVWNGDAKSITMQPNDDQEKPSAADN